MLHQPTLSFVLFGQQKKNKEKKKTPKRNETVSGENMYLKQQVHLLCATFFFYYAFLIITRIKHKRKENI